MSVKKYYFLSGMPRSGNTLLASILNQNKKIAVTANSILPEILYNFENFKYCDRGYKNFSDLKSYESMMSQLIPSYYKNWNQRYIIDRGSWGTPDNLTLLKKYCPNKIKIIVLLRDVTDILASFIKWSKENPNNFIDREYKTIEDQCDYLMNPHGQIAKTMLSAFTLFKEENLKYSTFIEYDSLVNNPQETIDEIYDFLGICKYTHRFQNLNDLELNGLKYDDSEFGKNLHKVKKDLKKTEYSAEDYLPKSVIEKYREFTFWKKS